MTLRSALIAALITFTATTAAYAAGNGYYMKYAGMTTNDLAKDKQFQQVTGTFFAGQKAAGQNIVDTLIGKPDDILLSDDRYLVASACNAKRCEEKGVAFIDTQSSELAYALVQPTGNLNVYFKNNAGGSFKQWVIAKVAEWQENYKEDMKFSYIATLKPSIVTLK
jgi:hypothetical protein